ncbi:MAG: hypothetical protein U1D69_11615 [Polynucleobacter sp.]|jgi:hypothetical protein|nr:hypothetical protein [Polynucleobacter sp.]
MRACRLVTLLIIAASASAQAHQDRQIDIKQDGRLEGLPDAYAPAKLNVNFKRTPENSYIESIELSVSGVNTVVPSCASAIIASRSMSEVRASASWYHTRSTLPPYLNVSFFDPGVDPGSWPAPKFSLLFNLETSKLISVVVHVARKNPTSEQMLPIDLSSRCPKEQLDIFYAPLDRLSAQV